ncbi:Sorting nexin-5 [Thelohanellus kitauei]|uniref:Sorting nexin-5 n=1 Tax=Thelohanellus kitauei TaxID=669202 RepID=A0A0C2MNB2_THEKT|nr:Sorting nexin-5 [Thelohanellus kitauei]
MSDSWSWLGKPEPDVDSFFDIINKQTATDFELYGRLLADAEKMIVCEKRISNFKVIWSQAYEVLSRLNAEHEFFFHVGKFFEHIRNIELAIPQKEDLHLVQLIKYHHNMTKATKDTLGRRKDVLKKKKLSAVAYETAQRTGQNVGIASENFKGDEKKFEDISDLCKAEINSYQRERVALFKANLTDYCKFQIEYSQVNGK